MTVVATLVLSGYDELTGALIVAVVLADKHPVEALSEASVGHRIEISAHGKHVMTSVVREPWLDGSFQMTTSREDELRALAAQFADGPATLVIDVAE
ncbi:MAG: hypothetical protein J0H89_10175 [Rhizobiales bacterium]|nr:hypothetical protein [Hyphomicrobiales bacterium]